MAFPDGIYTEPNVYIQTFFEAPTQAILSGLRFPVFVGTGSEILQTQNLEVIRGSSSYVDQRVVKEDVTGRAVVSISDSGAVTLGAFNGILDRIQMRHYPLVDGKGTGTPAVKTSAVTVTLNGTPIVPLSIDAARGIIRLSTPPSLGDDVRVTYYFKRTDTQFTDDLSDQVSADSAVVLGAVSETFEVVAGVNDTLIFAVDSDTTTITITLPESGPGAPWTAAQVAAFINAGAAATSLVADTFTNSFGNLAVRVTADRDITVGNGTANSTIGFTNGYATARNRVFYTFQGPIVDGSNGGITTTDPSDVSVTVDNIAVTPVAVDGQSRAVTLPFAPAVGSTVRVVYWQNTWQDTFDYLANINVTEVVRAGDTPDRSDYVQGADFVLSDDKVLWGTAVLVSTGVHTEGTEFFGESQISATLVDVRQYLAPCSAVVNTAVNPPRASTTQFTLPLVPTTGNGRSTPLGQNLYASVSNGRIDLPTNRPDLVTAYWGFSVQDAIERGAVAVTKVDSSTSTITLATPVPPGAQVYATFYYNTLGDQDYTFTVDTAGAAGVGTYTVQDENGNDILTPKFASKSAGLTGITVQFPSGSERTPDVRFETPFTTSSYEGPVEENVTVTFAAKDGTLGTWTSEYASPWAFIPGASDHLRLTVDGGALDVGAVGIDLSNVSGDAGLGFHAVHVGGEVEYDSTNNYTDYTIDASNNQIDLFLDGVLVQATAAAATGSLANFVTAINTAAAATPPTYHGAARFSSAFVVTAGVHDTLAFHYTGDVSGASGNLYATIAPGTYNSATQLAAAIQDGVDLAILASGVGADPTVAVSATTNSEIEFALTRGTGDAAGMLEFVSVAAVATVAANVITINDTSLTALDEFEIAGITLTGVAGARTPGSDDFRIDGTAGAGTAASIASEIVDAINDGANSFAGTVTALLDGTRVVILTVATGSAANATTLTATLATPTDATVASPTFFGATDGVVSDFATLAGIDTDLATLGTQSKLVDGPVARRFTIAGDNTGARLHDRIILRNRFVPGSSTVDRAATEGLATLTVGGGSGNALCGLTAGDVARGAVTATVQGASLLARVGLSGGQVAAGTYSDARDGQALITFYADGGSTAQNNVLKLTINGTPVTVTFTDAAGVAIASGSSADVPLGPVGTANTVLAQIQAAITAAGISASVKQEGFGIRIRSNVLTSAASIVVGTGNANSTLGFSAGTEVRRTTVDADVLASCLMGDNGDATSEDANQYLDWATPTTWNGPGAVVFAGEALAIVVSDAGGAEYLSIQSQGNAGLGTTSSIAVAAATADNVYLPGTGFEVSVGDGGSGEAGISGFYVTSSDPADGSGSVNTSVLNTAVTGEGQDGVVGQTYRDLVTGLTFTILPREGGSNYPAGETVVFSVRRVVTTDSNLPINTIPGAEVLVTNTLGVGEGDTALVSTYERGGQEPAIGDSYYVTYNYRKEDFGTRLYTRLSAIEQEYGANGPENPVTLASFVALTNGAVLVGVNQVVKDVDEDGDGIFDSATTSAYIDAVNDMEGSLPGGVLLSYIVPVGLPSSDTASFFSFLARHCDIQSTIRRRAERTAICGFPAGTLPRTAGDIAASVNRSRLRVVYPDIVTLTLTQADGTDDQHLVDGSYLAAAIAGAISSPTRDVATPWTGLRLFGFDNLARVLDAVEMNQTAVRGVTVLEDRPSFIRVRQGLTTQMENLLTKLPTVLQIADHVQQQTRVALERFIGVKFLPGILSQIEGALGNTLKLLVQAEIITAYTGVKANVAADDPTVSEVQAWYQPVFPLLYILVTFNLRSSL